MRCGALCSLACRLIPPHPPTHPPTTAYGGKNCDVNAYLDKTKVTEGLKSSLEGVAAIRNAVAPSVLLVLEEVAGSSGGGCDNVTDRFVAGFPWLATLASVGEAGFDRLHRQDIAGWSFAYGKSNYMLVGPPGWTNGTHETLTPHPDYFTTLLWRQLVGTTVLSSSMSGDDSLFLSSAWCAGARAPYGAGGSVVVVFANLADSAQTVSLPPVLAAAPFTYFAMTPSTQPATFDDLHSDSVFLNGKLLSVEADGTLPSFPFSGVAASPEAELVADAYSYGFVVFNTAAKDAPACAAA